MKRSSKELKRIARDMLNNRYNVPMGAFVTASFITAVIEIPFSLSLGDYPTTSQVVITLLAEYLILLIGQVLSAGVVLVHLNMTRNQTYKITTLFDPFRRGTERFFLAAFLLSIFSLICYLPVILGMVFYHFNETHSLAIPILICTGILSLILFIAFLLNYNFVYFFLLDYSDMKVTAAFRESRLMMKKNKARLLLLVVSFLGWIIPVLFSFGIATLWVSPYMNQTVVNFYLDCTGELNRIPVRDYSAATGSSQNSIL